jgi:2,4-dienoyl-CoA reductase-like NADH-dependent reductase (Old Yellow Enzyme family)
MSPTTQAPRRAFTPGRIGPVEVPNRIIKAATFEGRTRRGLVTDELIEFHCRFARGGVGMTTVAYCAVNQEGSIDGRQVRLDLPGAARGLARLADAVHRAGAKVSAQIGHSGPLGTLAPSRVFSASRMRWTRAARGEDLERIAGDFARAALLLADAGFDAIEVHLGHDYLLSAFLSPRLNRRTDAWGGTLEKRARFPRLVLEEVRKAVDGRVAVTAKLNMLDDLPGGLQLEDSVAVARLLEADGTVDAITLTGGSSFANPMFLFRGDPPIASMAERFPRLMRPAAKLLLRRLFRPYPFREAFFLDEAKQFRSALRLPLILLGGITSLSSVERALEEGFEFVQIGRALLREPELVQSWRSDPQHRSLCTHCNECVPTIYTRTRCVLADPETPIPRLQSEPAASRIEL